jgi:hypothetical protein
MAEMADGARIVRGDVRLPLRLLMKSFRLVLMCFAIPAISIATEHNVSQEVPLVATSAMIRLQASFRQASTPQKDDLLGTWVLIRHVATEEFITGMQGPDHVLFDPQGIKHGAKRLGASPQENNQLSPMEWRLTFRASSSGDPQVTSDTAWIPSGDTSSVHFTSEGDLIFEKDYGGDSKLIYRCRTLTARNLICLLRNREDSHGIEFLKISK